MCASWFAWVRDRFSSSNGVHRENATARHIESESRREATDASWIEARSGAPGSVRPASKSPSIAKYNANGWDEV
jgi:hypothetical protein